jgi:hypothetical protein
MTGGALLGLILLSMAWCFYLFGLAVHVQIVRKRLKAKGMGFLPAVSGSLAVFFSIPVLASHGIEVPWPWLWILLPLAADPYLWVLLARR